MSLIDEYLLEKEETRRVRPPNTYYLYDLTSPCITEVILGMFLDKPYPIDALRNFDAGNTLQDWWRNKLVSMGHQIIREESRVRHHEKKYSIHGRFDLITQFDYGPFILREVKTMKSADWLREEKEEHGDQAQFYLNKTGIENGSVDYIDKLAFALGNKPREYLFSIKKKPQTLKKLISRADIIHPYAEFAWDLIEREIKDYTRLHLPSPMECWKCDRKNRDRKIYCNYFEECQRLMKEESDG